MINPLLPTATGKHGLHICAELRMSAITLQRQHVDWAADVMERAAKHIEALEEIQLRLEPQHNEI